VRGMDRRLPVVCISEVSVTPIGDIGDEKRRFCGVKADVAVATIESMAPMN